MKVIRSLEEMEYDPRSVVTVGTFDGVHRAHQEIIREVQHRARMREGRSVVVTFNPHPKEVVGKGGAVLLLTTLDERIAAIERLEVDLLLIITFTHEFSRLSSRDFFREYIVHGTGVSEVVVGYDHMFGRNREAGIENLIRLGQEYKFSVFAVQPFMIDGEVVSSTVIRNSLACGGVEKAASLLGSMYTIEGRVVAGDGKGRQLGYPTANIVPTVKNKIVPANGVYLVTVDLEGCAYVGMMNIGTRPTLTDGGSTVMEVHIFEFNQDIYGRRVRIGFRSRLREEKKFSSVDELKAQLARDKEISLRAVSNTVRNS